MRRTIPALVLLVMLAPSAFARKILAPLGIAQQLVQSDAVVVGKVTSIEKELVEVKSRPEATETTAYTVAIVKVETVIHGVKNATHVKVGFILRAVPQDEELRFEDDGRRNLNLDEKGEYLLFLRKHPSAGFYTFDYSTPPQPLPAEAAVAEAKLAAAAIADPMKALRAEKAQERAFAAMVLLIHYRQPAQRGATDSVAIGAEENAAILNAISEGDWTVAITGYTTLSSAYQYLGLSATDGWQHPIAKPGENHHLVMQKAFQDWLAGPGAKFRFQRSVAKKN